MTHGRSRHARHLLTAALIAALAALLAPLPEARAERRGLAEWSCQRCRELAATWRSASSRDSLRWDETTGADARAYPPDRLVDYRHMTLRMDIPDMNTPKFTAEQKLTFSAIGVPVEAIDLDAVQLDIQSVEGTRGDSGRPLPLDWSYDGEKLTIAFDEPLKAGESGALTINYSANDPVDGLFWTPEQEQWAGRPPQIHTQGQPETNRFWFPCHDFPNERLSTELIVTVPPGFIVSSNGRLVSHVVRGGRETWRWLQEQPHPNYLVSLVVGKFDVVNVGEEGSLPMPVYVPPGKGPLVEQTYGNTDEMTDVFEDRFGVPYPWDRYAQLVVWNFGAGGMENTAATTMYDTAILDEKALLDGDLDPLIAHELGHQWFGDLLTCDSWAHIWLNEGFATYSESLWFEVRDGWDEGYLYDCWRNNRGVARGDRLSGESSASRPPMVSNLYEHPWDVFRRRSNPYPKGATVLHMLRMKMGDETFFDAIQTYTRRFRNATVETNDLREVMEEVSGLNLEQFFTQWTKRPGTPEVKVEVDWREASSQLHLAVEQTQHIGPMTPAFAFDLPVHVEADGEMKTITIPVSERRHERTIDLPEEPTMVVVDPRAEVLMTPTVRQPAKRFIEQLRRGPTIPARLEAADALEKHKSEATIEALAAVVGNTGEFHAVRGAAAGALGELGAGEALIRLARAGIDDARVREEVMDALAEAGGDKALAVLVEHASNVDESYATRAAALLGVGELGDASHLQVLIDALDDDSQHEQVRRAAVRAIAELGVEGGLEAVIPFTQLGWNQRLRPAAIRAVADLAEHDSDLAYETLLPLLEDHEDRTRRTAAMALVEIADERALETLRRLARTDPHPVYRDLFASSADRLAANARKDSTIVEVREELETLRRELDELKK